MEGPVEGRSVVVNSAAGHLCVVDDICSSWHISNLKEAIHKVTGINPVEQRLIYDLRELPDVELLDDLLNIERPEVTLVRRTQQQVLWLRLAVEDWSELLNQSAEVWDDKSTVFAAVSSCGWALQYASEPLRNDKAIALAAVRQNGLALQFASSDLRGDSDLTLEAVAQCGRAFKFCSTKLQRDRGFVLQAVKANGHVLKYVDEELQDSEVMSAAIDQCGSILSSIVGTTFEQSSRRSRIKHVLQDKGVLGADGNNASLEIPSLDECGSTCFFGLCQSTRHVTLAKQLGKDATQLCEMGNLGLPVPPGFCLTDSSWPSVKMAMSHVETFLQKGFGSLDKPLLMSLRGSSQEVIGLGLTDEIAERMALQENANCVWDSYRRLLASYAQVVCEVDPKPFDEELQKLKQQLSARDWLGGQIEDWQLPTSELRSLVETYKDILEEKLGEPFPQNPEVQLQRTLEALAKNSQGCAIIAKSMIFGNYDSDSGAGVLNLRETGLSGTWLPKAQTEDLGRRTGRRLSKEASQEWAQAHNISDNVRQSDFLSLEEKFLPVCAGLAHCKDMLSRAQHVEIDAVHFAVQQGRLWLLGPAPTTPATAAMTATTDTTPSSFSECHSLASEDLSMHAEEEDLVEVISNASEPMTEETEAPTTPRVFVQNVQPRSSKRGPCRPHGVLRLPWFRRFRRLSERSRSQSSTECAEKAQTLQTQQTQWAQGLAMPLWQTMLAGGLACVFHRAVAGSIEDMMRGRQASVAQNILKFSKGGFPFGALCCSFYVNFLHFSAPSASDTLGPFERFSCASAAVTLASIATYPLNAQHSIRGSALYKHGMKALASTNPVAAVELCSIDMARHLGNSYGYSSGFGLLFASGCAAGCVAQSVVHAHNALTQSQRSCETRTRKEKFQAFCRAAGPSFLKHAPAVGVNSLVRVGLVTHFMNQQTDI